MSWAKDYDVAGQLSIDDWMRASEINEGNLEEIVKKLGEEFDIEFSFVMGRTKRYAEAKIKKATISLSVDGINKLRIGYATLLYGRSHLVDSIDDAKKYLRSYKLRAEYSDQKGGK